MADLNGYTIEHGAPISHVDDDYPQNFGTNGTIGTAGRDGWPEPI